MALPNNSGHLDVAPRHGSLNTSASTSGRPGTNAPARPALLPTGHGRGQAPQLSPLLSLGRAHHPDRACWRKGELYQLRDEDGEAITEPKAKLSAPTASRSTSRSGPPVAGTCRPKSSRTGWRVQVERSRPRRSLRPPTRQEKKLVNEYVRLRGLTAVRNSPHLEVPRQSDRAAHAQLRQQGSRRPKTGLGTLAAERTISTPLTSPSRPTSTDD